MALGLNDFDAGKSITQATPSNGPLTDLPASKSLRPAPYKIQVHYSYIHCKVGRAIIK
jgi:hypothetical protein